MNSLIFVNVRDISVFSSWRSSLGDSTNSKKNLASAYYVCFRIMLDGIGRASGSRYMARLRATGAGLGTGHKNNIRRKTVVTSD